jgi:hypothetical protein
MVVFSKAFITRRTTMHQAEFVKLMNECRQSQGLPVMTQQEEKQDYEEYLREEEQASRHR